MPVLPVFELHRTKAMVDPTVDVGKHARRLCQPEVALPARQIHSERLAHLRETAPGAAPGQLAHALLHAFDGLWCHAPPDRSSLANPEREAKELRCRGAPHLALGFVDAELQL